MASKSTLSHIVSDLENPSTVRNDLSVVAGLVATVAGVVFHKSIPAAPDAVLVAGGLLLATVTRVVSTIVHGGLTRKALEADWATLWKDVPEIISDVESVKSAVAPSKLNQPNQPLGSNPQPLVSAGK